MFSRYQSSSISSTLAPSGFSLYLELLLLYIYLSHQVLYLQPKSCICSKGPTLTPIKNREEFSLSISTHPSINNSTMQMGRCSSRGEGDAMGVVVIPSSNEWPQSMPEDSLFLMPTTTTTSAAAVMDRAQPQKQKQQQLKCPRCDSANTKFCYYNNYSLTQPRHFCKACKRYWTLGGTLRNVPVGGGCRKNKRLKKPSPATSAADPSEFRPLPPPAPIQNQIDLRPSGLSPFFYALSSDMGNIPMVSCPDNYNLQPPQPQLQGLGLELGSQSVHQRQQGLDDGDYQSGFIYQFAAAMASSHDYPIPGSASLAEPSLKHARKVDDYLPFDGSLGFLKDVKIEGLPQTRIDWQLPCDHTPLQAITSAAASDAAADSMAEHGDSSFLYWNPIMGNPWSDANYGSSIAPLF